MFFIDESGSITQSSKPKNRYFVMSFVETDERYKVKRAFNEAKKNYIIKHPRFQGDFREEVKGSEMPVKMKRYIFDQLKKTNIKYHYIVVDNINLSSNMHRDVELAFNFVCDRFFEPYLSFNYNDSYNLEMILDERNCTVKSLNSLGDYLKTELCIKNSIVNDVKRCEYADSKAYSCLQVTDMFSNLVYRACQAEIRGKTNDGNIKLLKEIDPQGNMYFPNKYQNLSFFSSPVKFR